MITSPLKYKMVKLHRLAALRGVHDGTPRTADYFSSCIGIHPQSGTKLILTRDAGHHTCGWWKNPDYDRCWHLSLSFFHPEVGIPVSKNKALTKDWLDRVFRQNVTKIWCEPPYGEKGKRNDVWHYRLFCDENWTPIIPRKEVYTRTFTEAGWMSYSEVQEKKKRESEEFRQKILG